MEERIYTIGDKKYRQRPLVLGQVNQLMAVLRGIALPDSLDPQAILLVLGSRMPKAMAIVLLEDDKISEKSVREIAQYLIDREIQPLADEIEFTIGPETAAQVIEDFFTCNPILSIIERLGLMGEKIREKLPTKIRSPSSSASSPAATSQSETPSSGATPSPSADRMSSTESARSSSAKPSSPS